MQHSEILALSFDENKSSKTDMKKILNSIIKGKMPFNELLLHTGMVLYSKQKDLLGENVYTVLEAIFHAAIENKRWHIARKAEQLLHDVFDKDPKIMRNNYSMSSSLGLKSKALAQFKQLHEENLLDQDTRKRKIALLRSTDNIKDYVNELNNYIDIYPLDKEAWLELADVYMEYLNYEKALYCYEEVLILDPESLNNMMRIGELYYTIGNQPENLVMARKYFSFILSVDEKNYRASQNLKLVTKI